MSGLDEWERRLNQMKAERDQWKHEAETNATKLVGEMKQRSQITELGRTIEHLQKSLTKEREGFTKRRRDKQEQWRNLEAQRDNLRVHLEKVCDYLETANRIIIRDARGDEVIAAARAVLK